MPITSDLYCKTHDKRLSARGGRYHFKNGCEVWYLDAQGQPSHRYGEKSSPGGKPSPELKKTSTITSESLNQHGAGVEEHVRGFKEPAPEILFIYYPGGRVERLWDRFPDHQSIYTALVEGKYFVGTPAEFVEASARFMLAAAGYESIPCIIPTDMKPAYDETARLIKEGVLIAVWEDGKMKLEVNHKEEESHAGDHITQEGV